MGYAARRNLSKWDTLRVEIFQKGIRYEKDFLRSNPKKAFLAEGNPKTNAKKRCHPKVAPFFVRASERNIYARFT